MKLPHKLIVYFRGISARGLTVPPTLLARADEVIEWMAECLLMVQSAHSGASYECSLSR
ncbi:MAG: hypothetical protein WAN42_12460 [Pseudolabrys sp.]